MRRGVVSAVVLLLCLSVSAAFAAYTTRGSTNNGTQATGASSAPAIDIERDYVAFQSSASDLVSGDSNGVQDIFLVSLWGGAPVRMSLGVDFAEANGDSAKPSVSACFYPYLYVAYESAASNLVDGDTNDVTDVFVSAYDVCEDTFSSTFRASVASDGTEANGASKSASVAAYSPLVAFESVATDLVDGDTNGVSDIFVRDWNADTTTRVSVASDGTEANGPSYLPVISADGTCVVFISEATNLVPGVADGKPHVYLRDLEAGTTEVVDLATDGGLANGAAVGRPAVSQDGRFVAFASDATNLVEGDTNGVTDIFRRDRKKSLTVRVSTADDGTEANGASSAPAIGVDGRMVAFASLASNLVPGDMNGVKDVFVRDVTLETTMCASVPPGSATSGGGGLVRSLVPASEADGPSDEPAILMDDRFDCGNDWFAVFSSDATNLVADDTNGVTDVFIREYVNSGCNDPTDSSYPDYSTICMNPQWESTTDNSEFPGTITINGHPFEVNQDGSETYLTAPAWAVTQLGATASPGYQFLSWDCCWENADGEASITNPGSTLFVCKGLWAIFQEVPLTLTVDGSGGSLLVDDTPQYLPYSGTYYLNDQVTLQAVPDADHIFVGWAGGVTGTDNPVTVTIEDNTAITALFALPEVTLNLTTTGEGSVTVNGAPVDTPYTYTYPGGATLALEATPAPGWEFTGWAGDVSSMANPISVQLLENMNIGATFAPIDPTPRTLSITGSGGGVSVDGVSQTLPYTGSFHTGEVVALEAAADAGHVFTGWTGDLTGKASPTSVTIPSHDLSIIAHFPTSSVAVTIAGAGKGSVKVNGALHSLPWSGTLDAGSTVALEAVPDTGWVFSEWTGDVTGNDNPASAELLEPISVTAAFTATPVTLQVNGSGDGDGAVKVNGALHSLPWSGVFDYGSTVTVEATPGDCDWFRGWSGDLSGRTTPATITLNGDRAVTADFAPISIFTDVGCTNWAALDIVLCADAGIVSGYPDGTYLPNAQVSRDQMAVFISRAVAGGDALVPTAPATATFPDVDPSYWAFKYIEYVASKDIVTGYPDGTYRPSDVLDRDQMAAYIARSIATPVGEGGLASYTPPTKASYSDVATTYWAFKYIEYLKAQGVVSGYPDGTYHPTDPVTRDQMAVFIAKAFKLQ